MNKYLKPLILTFSILTLSFSLISCDFSRDNNSNSNSNSIENKDNENTSEKIDKSNDNKNSSLKPEDFIIKYNDYEISMDSSVSDIIETLGKGTTNEDNSDSFIGLDSSEKFKFYIHKYNKDNTLLDIITQVNISSGESRINEIDISNIGTIRNIKKGDSYNNIIDSYGEPNETKQIDEGKTDYIYKLNNDLLIFLVTDTSKTIEKISLLNSDSLKMQNIK